MPFVPIEAKLFFQPNPPKCEECQSESYHEMKCRGGGDQGCHCVHGVVVEERAENI